MGRIKVTKTTKYFLIDKPEETEITYYPYENITQDFFRVLQPTKEGLKFINDDFETGKDDINNYSCLNGVTYLKTDDHALEYTLYMYANKTGKLDFTEHFLIETVTDDTDFTDGDTWFKYYYTYDVNYNHTYDYTVKSKTPDIKDDMLYNQYKVTDIRVRDQYSWIYDCLDDCSFVESIHADLVTDDIKHMDNLFCDYEVLVHNVFGNN